MKSFEELAGDEADNLRGALDHLAEICSEQITEYLDSSAEGRKQRGKLRGELKDADEYIEQLEEEIADLRCSYKEALHQLSKLKRAAA